MDQYIQFATNHYVLVFCLLCVIYLLIRDLMATAFTAFESISPLIAVTKMNGDNVLILDVRESNEFAKSHIEDARNITLDKLESSLSQLDAYKNHSIIVTCQTGARSAAACKTLSKNGFATVFNMAGGMQSWEDNKLPIKISTKKHD